jgi:hypothetical protein
MAGLYDRPCPRRDERGPGGLQSLERGESLPREANHQSHIADLAPGISMRTKKRTFQSSQMD